MPWCWAPEVTAEIRDTEKTDKSNIKQNFFPLLISGSPIPCEIAGKQQNQDVDGLGKTK